MVKNANQLTLLFSLLKIRIVVPGLEEFDIIDRTFLTSIHLTKHAEQKVNFSVLKVRSTFHVNTHGPNECSVDEQEAFLLVFPDQHPASAGGRTLYTGREESLQVFSGMRVLPDRL